jgi:HPt (histidine-containing phosphotransfer) domain-containing protein
MLFDRSTPDDSRDMHSFTISPMNVIRITNDAVDLDVLNAFQQLQPDDGSDLIVELIDLYLQDASQRITEITEASAKGEWVTVNRAAHNLRGSSSNLGVRHTAEICGELERADGRLARSAVAGLIERLKTELVRASELLIAERQRRLQ